MAVVRIFAMQKVSRGQGREALWSQGGKPPEILLRRSYPPQRAKFLYGGEVAKRFADLEQILFFFGQTLRSRFAAEKNSVKRNFAKPLLLSLRLHAQRKSGQTLLCNFDLMCFCLQPARRSCGFYLVPFCIKSERPRGSFHLPRGRSVSDSLFCGCAGHVQSVGLTNFLQASLVAIRFTIACCQEMLSELVCPTKHPMCESSRRRTVRFARRSLKFLAQPRPQQNRSSA